MANDLDIMARKLALMWVGEDANRGITEHQIRLSWHASSTPDTRKFPDGVKTRWSPYRGYTISVGGWYDYDTRTGLVRRRVPTSKVLVERVCNIEGVWIFSLHELYEESRRGQLSLL